MESLRRVLRTPGAVLLGLGSMVGTGLFVGIGLGASVAGQGVLLALLTAGVIALCNGLSSAQLAADHPVSGGTYEYGYRYLNPTLGFTAGVTFLLAKSASAATAALGVAAYLGSALDLPDGMTRAIAFSSVVLFTLLVLTGLRRSNRMNGLLVAITLLVLGAFALPPIVALDLSGLDLREIFSLESPAAILHATALLFVAYTGYGRVATLGEEVVSPERTIPRAVVVTVAATLLLYLLVAVAALGGIGATGFGEAAISGEGPLEVVLEGTGREGLIPVLTIGAITAMAGVLLNLILGLSRVLLAMARRGDAPSILARLDDRGESPRPAVLAVGGLIALLTLFGNMMTTWSLSAFTVLIYYGITNLAALRLDPGARRFPRSISLLGLLGCLGLAWWVEPIILAIGCGSVLLLIGVRRVVRGSTGHRRR